MVLAGAQPLEVGRHLAIDGGVYGTGGRHADIRRRDSQDGPRKFLRRRQVQKTVDVGQMAAVELVELYAIGRLVLRAVPPAPVAAFGDQQFLVRQAAVAFGDAGGDVVCGAGAQQLGPGLVVFLGADPDIEVGVDPGAREDVVQRLRRHQAERLAGGDGAKSRVVADALVEFAEERAAVEVIVFPRILAVEDDGHEGVAAGGQNARAILADAVQEIGGGMGRFHLGIDEADQVAHEMIAEDQPHGAALLAPLVGTVQTFHRHGALLGAVEHAAIGGGPLETQFAGQGEDFVRN